MSIPWSRITDKPWSKPTLCVRQKEDVPALERLKAPLASHLSTGARQPMSARETLCTSSAHAVVMQHMELTLTAIRAVHEHYRGNILAEMQQRERDQQATTPQAKRSRARASGTAARPGAERDGTGGAQTEAVSRADGAAEGGAPWPGSALATRGCPFDCNHIHAWMLMQQRCRLCFQVPTTWSC